MTLPNLQQNRFLSELTTFGIGGPALYLVEVRQIAEMQASLRFAQEKKLPYLILGKGSNSLCDDRGFNGLVIVNKIDFNEQTTPGVFHVGAGYSFSLLGTQTARQGFSGLEFASGIPGSVGGAVFMNAGANGSETCTPLTSVDYVTPEGELKVLLKEELHFAYRHSSFQSMPGAIVGATFHLKAAKDARQKQLDIIGYRTKTQPYGDKSAGCVFRNPNCGHAGALIDKSGLKGASIGGAKVSEMHANFVVNTGLATSKDVLNLIKHIQKEVQDKAGIELTPEIRYIPYDFEVK